MVSLRQEISERTRQEWQSIVDLVVRLVGGQVGLIMGVAEDEIEVLVASQTPQNPYQVGQKAALVGSGLYCEAVVTGRTSLMVLNALKSEQWKNNPALQDHMISYLGFPIRSRTGEILGTICVMDQKENAYSQEAIALLEKMRDLIENQIRAEKQAEQQQEFWKSEGAKFRLAFEHANIGLCLVDLQGTLMEVNAKMSAILGHHIIELEGQPLDELSLPGEPSLWAQLQQHDEVSLEKRYRHQQGHFIDVEVSSSLIRDRQGNPIYFIVQLQDITERKQSEEKLRISEKRHRFLANNAHDVIWTMQADGRITYISPAIEQVRGFPPEEAMAQPLDQILTPDSQAIVIAYLQQLNADIQAGVFPTSFRGDLEYHCKDGSTYWTEVMAYPILSSDGTFQEILGVTRNINDRKRYEQQLKQAYDAITQLNSELEARVNERTQELQQREAALRESQYFSQQIADTSPQIIYLFDLQEQTNVYVNREIERVLGYSPEEIQAMGSQFFCNLMHPDDLARLPQSMAQLFQAQDGEIFDIEYRMRDRQGQWHWLYSRHTVFSRTEQGAVKYTIGAAQDITARKLAEENLAQSHAKFQRLVNDIGDQFVVFSHTGVDGILTYVSGGFEPVFGITREQIIGYPWATLINWVEEDAQQAQNLLLQSIAYDTKELDFQQFEMRFFHPNGQLRTISVSQHIVKNEAGECIAVDGILEDITERQNIAQRLAESETKYRNLVENTNDLIYSLDLAGNVTYVSPNGQELLGMAPEAMVNFPYVDIIHPEDRDRWQAFFQTVIQGEKKQGFEYRVSKTNGEWQWYTTSGAPQWDEKMGQVVAYLGVAYDITARKLSEIQLQLMNEELLQASRLKDDFLAMMSHELRTPLNAILGMTECLQEEIFGPVTEKQGDALNTIDSSGHHLLDLINDILDFSKMAAGKLPLEFRAIALPALCETGMTMLQPQANKKRIHLQMQTLAKTAVVWGDERRLHQVFLNLLSNAIKFTPEGGKITIILTDAPEPETGDPYVRMEVLDTGIGIAPKNLGRLFQPFVQIDSALSRKYEGTGLGLALTKQIVERHGGRVGVSSEEGKGSCFWVDLPQGDRRSFEIPLVASQSQQTLSGE